MTTDTADTITAYRDGRFTTEPCPAWWEAETNVPLPEQSPLKIGDDCGYHVQTMPLATGHGHYVGFVDFARCIDVWAPTDADLLTLLTGPAKTFTTLREGASIEDSLDDVRNALLGYFRHGQGEHIDILGGENRIDRGRHAQRRRKGWEAEQAVCAPRSGG